MKIHKKYIGDIILSVLILTICVILGIFVYTRSTESNNVIVTYNGKACVTLNLNKNTVYSPDGNHTIITVKNAKAYISSSDCPDGLCMKMPPVTKNGGGVICLPNRITITAEKNNSGGTDYVAG